MAEKCPYAFRKRTDKSVHCKHLVNENFDYCAHQYMCPNTKRWEASPWAEDCPLRKKPLKK